LRAREINGEKRGGNAAACFDFWPEIRRECYFISVISWYIHNTLIFVPVNL